MSRAEREARVSSLYAVAKATLNARGMKPSVELLDEIVAGLHRSGDAYRGSSVVKAAVEGLADAFERNTRDWGSDGGGVRRKSIADDLPSSAASFDSGLATDSLDRAASINNLRAVVQAYEGVQNSSGGSLAGVPMTHPTGFSSNPDDPARTPATVGTLASTRERQWAGDAHMLDLTVPENVARVLVDSSPEATFAKAKRRLEEVQAFGDEDLAPAVPAVSGRGPWK